MTTSANHATEHNGTTNDAGFPPAPPEAHRRAGVLDEPVHEVRLNGSRILMRLEAEGWINFHVS